MPWTAPPTHAVVMTRSGSSRSRDPFRASDLLGSVWSALWASAAVAPVSTGASAAYRTLFLTLRRLVVGRRLTVRLDGGELKATVTEFRSSPDVTSLSSGQLGHVHLTASDIHWRSSRFDRTTIDMYDVRMQRSTPPMLVAGPIELSVHLAPAALDELFRWVAPRLAGEVGADGVARLRLATRPAMGHLEVDARLDGATLWLKPRVLGLRRSRWGLPAFAPAYPVRLPELPHGLQLTGVSFAPGEVRVSGALPEWRMELPRTRLEQILDQLSTAGRPLNLTWRGRTR